MVSPGSKNIAALELPRLLNRDRFCLNDALSHLGFVVDKQTIMGFLIAELAAKNDAYVPVFS